MKEDKFKELKKAYNNIDVPDEVDFSIEKGIKRGKAHKRTVKAAYVTAATILLAFTAVLSIKSGLTFLRTSPWQNSQVAVVENSNLPVVGSAEKLQTLLKDYISGENTSNYEAVDGALPKSAGQSQITNGAESQSSAAKDYSGTNVQVQGVDEEDLVKTDGSYIYKVSSNKIINIVKAVPASSIETVNNITFDENYTVAGIYLKNNILIVIGNGYQKVSTQSSSNKAYIIPEYSRTKIVTYDVSEKKNIKKLREMEFDGAFTSSRMVGSMVYVISNKSLYNIGNIKEDPDLGKVYYSDSAAGKDELSIDYSNIAYLPEAVEPNYIITASFNADKSEKFYVNAFLGSGSNIYASEKNLYVAGYKRNISADNAYNNVTTAIYKFTLGTKGISLASEGQVPGTIINQFSMDESGDNFRVATTSYNYTSNKSDTQVETQSQGTAESGKSVIINPVQMKMTNNVYVLDKDLKVLGKIEGIAEGEKIYSVRFMGDRAYMVTYMLTDPLFVIDLKEPANPKILGELKIPGFSNNLQPYDDTHIIGFGKDTTVVNEGGTNMARPLGLKIAIFDVSDVTNPKQQFTTVIGDSGTYSDVLYNHKALLFSKEKNLMVLPVDDRIESYTGDVSRKAFQGAYVYNINLVTGLTLRGKITHEDADTETADQNNKIYESLYGNYRVDRSLYINNVLYTISNACIKANDINSLQELGKAMLKVSK